MPSFEKVNYSLRPSKSIQRGLVFEGLRAIKERLALADPVYIGLGSVWFSDFLMAHSALDVWDMVSIESDEIGFERAKFNCPFATVKVKKGEAGVVIQDLKNGAEYSQRPWMVWLDYDSELDESVCQDLAYLNRNAPENSVIIFTFNAHEGNYGKPAAQRRSRVIELLGRVVSEDEPPASFKNKYGAFEKRLAKAVIDHMISDAVKCGREGGAVPAFNLRYKDGSPMVTVGGILPSKQNRAAAEELVKSEHWDYISEALIAAPNLTLLEVAHLQKLLPSSAPITR
ncbi:O-methyltransferase, partial [Guyparkeria sp. SB14A]